MQVLVRDISDGILPVIPKLKNCLRDLDMLIFFLKDGVLLRKTEFIIIERFKRSHYMINWKEANAILDNLEPSYYTIQTSSAESDFVHKGPPVVFLF